ncbi:hypothetical protein MMC10_006517 [Thelotrema lepadinum]|nr:hypothetical protein [Thelotrema lepadinum]
MNSGLPAVSDSLQDTLMCHNTVKRMIKRLFCYENELCSCRSTLSEEETEELGTHQSQLLEQVWCTSELLELCQREVLLKRLKGAWFHFETVYPNAIHDRLRMTSALEKLTTTSASASNDVLKASGFDYYPKKGDDSTSFSVALEREGDHPFKSLTRIYVDISHTQKQHCESVDCNQLHPLIGAGMTFEMPRVSEQLFVPDRLLQGPWNMDMIKLLRWLSTEFAFEWQEVGYDLEYNKSLASTALKAAIRDNCVPVITLLAVPSSNCWYAAIVAARSASGTTQDPPEVPEEEMDTTIEADLFLSRTPGAFNVAITDEHLVVALEAAEHANDPEAGIFCSLLPVACLQQFDEIDAPEPNNLFLLVNYALQKKTEEAKRGITEGFGSLALRRLDEAQGFARQIVKEKAVLGQAVEDWDE